LFTRRRRRALRRLRLMKVSPHPCP
jgi:hypothetical protein